jgi:PAS domain S-box-containing protein
MAGSSKRPKDGAQPPPDQLQTLAALQESEDKFRVLAEKSLVGVYLIQDDVFRYVNPRFTEIYHYAAEEMVDRIGPKQLVLPEDWQTVEANIEERLAGRMESIHYEFMGVTKEGERIFVEVYGSRTTYRGRPAVIGTLLDITERKQREHLLAQAEEKYRTIFENAVEGIFQITPKGQFIVVNPALERMLGFGADGSLIADTAYVRHQLYVNPARRTQFMHILEKEGVALGFECELRKKDRSRIWGFP